MRNLIARVPVLTQGRQYAPGERLPTDDTALTALWLQYGSAYWDEPLAPKFVDADAAPARCAARRKK